MSSRYPSIDILYEEFTGSYNGKARTSMLSTPRRASSSGSRRSFSVPLSLVHNLTGLGGSVGLWGWPL